MNVDTLQTVQDIVGAFAVEVSPAGPVPPDRHLLELGVGSLQLLQIHAELEATLGIEFPKDALFDHPTVGALADYLAGCR